MNATLRTGQSSRGAPSPPSALPPGWGKPKSMSAENRAKLALAAKNASAATKRLVSNPELVRRMLTETPVEKQARLEAMERQRAVNEEARISRYGPGYVAPSVNLNSNSNNEGPTRGHFAVPLGTKTGPVRTRRVNRRSVLRKPNAASKKRSIVWSNARGGPLASLPNDPSVAAPLPRTREEMAAPYHRHRTGRWPHNDKNARAYRFYPARANPNHHNHVKPFATPFDREQQKRYRQALIERPTLLPADD